jgi:hypothetical protein
VEDLDGGASITIPLWKTRRGPSPSPLARRLATRFFQIAMVSDIKRAIFGQPIASVRNGLVHRLHRRDLLPCQRRGCSRAGLSQFTSHLALVHATLDEAVIPVRYLDGEAPAA